jgi:hypothetical protein
MLVSVLCITEPVHGSNMQARLAPSLALRKGTLSCRTISCSNSSATNPGTVATACRYANGNAHTRTHRACQDCQTVLHSACTRVHFSVPDLL